MAPSELLLEQPSLPGLCPVAEVVQALSTGAGTDERGGIYTRSEESIAALKAKPKLEKLCKRKIGVRKRAVDAKLERPKDTRRKILVGAAILAKVERGERPQEKLLAMLDETLDREDDRALFDILAIQTPKRSKSMEG